MYCIGSVQYHVTWFPRQQWINPGGYGYIAWYITKIMMTSSNENISALLAICVGNSPVTGEFPAQRPVTLSFHVFLDLRLNKRLPKHWGGWWFETPLRPLWRNCNENTTSCDLCVYFLYLLVYTVPRLSMNIDHLFRCGDFHYKGKTIRLSYLYNGNSYAGVWNFHYADKTVVRSSYIYHENPYAGKAASFYWDGTLCPCVINQELFEVFKRSKTTKQFSSYIVLVNVIFHFH